jgi:hypothetical protein
MGGALVVSQANGRTLMVADDVIRAFVKAWTAPARVPTARPRTLRVRAGIAQPLMRAAIGSTEKPPLATECVNGRVSAFVGQLRLSVHGTAPAPARTTGSCDYCQEHVFKRSISPRKMLHFPCLRNSPCLAFLPPYERCDSVTLRSADSTDRRNSLVKSFSWCFEV